MLNISANRVSIDRNEFPSLKKAEDRRSGRSLIYLLTGFLVLIVVTSFLPWTQNVMSRGKVTTLRPNQRPQAVESVIAGRIEKWFVQEGDVVSKGDTIVFISEVKDHYFDPDLLQRTRDQITAKQSALASYQGKVSALQDQMSVLSQGRDLKLQQAENKLAQAQFKVTSDSMDVVAAQLNLKVAREQNARQQRLYDQGLKSKTDLEKRQLALQKASADLIGKENRLLASRNDLINAQVALSAIEVEFQKDLVKTQSDQFSALSHQYDTEALITKMQNQYQNYSVRQGFYYIRAPQDGIITQAVQSGIGENIKEGAEIVTIMPSDYELAVEMFIRPLDLPLIKKGQEVRLQFDGWPAIVFSGWPNTSYGTFGGTVFAIDNFTNESGLYRILVSADPNAEPWPEALRVGGGAVNMILLKNVPIWYEVWRQINGFPPDYYETISDAPQRLKK
ncbi:MAG: HlyD family secretion protein [Saprospiraceae bacterium]|nr:HlyD family secretion protein [Saprospiraceae bacterium]